MKGSAERTLALESSDPTGIRSSPRWATASPPVRAASPAPAGPIAWRRRCAGRGRTFTTATSRGEGATTADVLEQIVTVIEIEPDLISLIAGANVTSC